MPACMGELLAHHITGKCLACDKLHQCQHETGIKLLADLSKAAREIRAERERQEWKGCR